jgi:hypothetical protein
MTKNFDIDGKNDYIYVEKKTRILYNDNLYKIRIGIAQLDSAFVLGTKYH